MKKQSKMQTAFLWLRKFFGSIWQRLQAPLCREKAELLIKFFKG